MIKQLRLTTEKGLADEQLPEVKALLDRLASKGIIHKNMAANYKRQLDRHVNRLGES